ncbi:MAG: hypothetical protein LUG13_10150 [Oscillospiraceae bacterium]|nr:hypothetical protein [Oscillospiraceae bacterium]
MPQGMNRQRGFAAGGNRQNRNNSFNQTNSTQTDAQAAALLAQGRALAAAAQENAAAQEHINRYPNPNFPACLLAQSTATSEGDIPASLERIQEILNEQTTLLDTMSEHMRRLTSAMLCTQNLR